MTAFKRRRTIVGSARFDGVEPLGNLRRTADDDHGQTRFIALNGFEQCYVSPRIGGAKNQVGIHLLRKVQAFSGSLEGLGMNDRLFAAKHLQEFGREGFIQTEQNNPEFFVLRHYEAGPPDPRVREE